MGAKQGGTTTTTQTSTPWAGLQPYLKSLYAGAGNLAQTDPFQAYPGQTVAPFNPQQLQALDLTQQRALSGSPVENAAQNANYAFNTGQFLSAGNPYFGNMVNQIAQQVNPQIASGFEQGGRLGSGAQANAFESALTNQAGNLAFQNYNQGLNNMIQSQALSPQLGQMDYQNLAQLYGVGQTLQGQQQNYINADVQRYLQNQQGPWQTLQGETGILGGIPVGSNTATSQPYFTNPVANVLGTGLGVASLFGKSDRRLKRDIEKIGSMKGLGIYRFRYLWSDDFYEGVMADEVAKIFPQAVIRGADGFLGVIYGLIGIPFRRIA